MSTLPSPNVLLPDCLPGPTPLTAIKKQDRLFATAHMPVVRRLSVLSYARSIYLWCLAQPSAIIAFLPTFPAVVVNSGRSHRVMLADAGLFWARAFRESIVRVPLTRFARCFTLVAYQITTSRACCMSDSEFDSLSTAETRIKPRLNHPSDSNQTMHCPRVSGAQASHFVCLLSSLFVCHFVCLLHISITFALTDRDDQSRISMCAPRCPPLPDYHIVMLMGTCAHS